MLLLAVVLQALDDAILELYFHESGHGAMGHQKACCGYHGYATVDLLARDNAPRGVKGVGKGPICRESGARGLQCLGDEAAQRGRPVVDGGLLCIRIQCSQGPVVVAQMERRQKGGRRCRGCIFNPMTEEVTCLSGVRWLLRTERDLELVWAESGDGDEKAGDLLVTERK